MTDQMGCGVWISFPLPEERVFRNQATEDILSLLIRNPHEEFTVSQLREITGHGGDTVATALDVLAATGLIETRRDGRRRLIRADGSHVRNPDDPILQIPQEEFRSPIRAFLIELEERDVDPVGVVLFGSVARGDADRASDVDVLAIVEGDAVSERRAVQSARQAVESRRFDGDRYEFQVMVETADSAENYGPKLRNVFSEGIVLTGSETLNAVKRGVFDGQ